MKLSAVTHGEPHAIGELPVGKRESQAFDVGAQQDLYGHRYLRRQFARNHHGLALFDIDQSLALPLRIVLLGLLVRLGFEADAIDQAAAIGLLAKQLEVIFFLFFGRQGEQVFADAVARIIIGHFVGHLVDELAIDIHLLISVAGLVVGDVFSLGLVFALESCEVFFKPRSSGATGIFAMLLARDSAASAKEAKPLLLMVDPVLALLQGMGLIFGYPGHDFGDSGLARTRR